MELPGQVRSQTRTREGVWERGETGDRFFWPLPFGLIPSSFSL